MIVPGGFFAASPTEIEPLPEGIFKMLGANLGWEEQVAEGDLWGVAPSFEFDDETVDHIYQRFNIYDPVAEGNPPSLVVGCIIGGYAICFENTASPDNRMFVTPYLMDDDLVLSSEWLDDYTLNIGTDVSAILPSEGTVISGSGVFPLSENKFVIASAPVNGQTTYDIKIATINSPNDISIVSTAFDIDDYITEEMSELDWTFAGGVRPLFAYNQITGQLGVVFQLHVLGPYYPGYIGFRLNTTSGSISNIIVNIGDSFADRHIAPIYLLSSIPQSALQVALGSSHQNVDCDNIAINWAASVGDPPNLVYSTYTGRTVEESGEAFLTVYSGQSGDITVNLNTALEAKLISLGYTVIGEPDFGELAYYLQYPD